VRGYERRKRTVWILITIFATSFVIALSGALMPGPLLTITLSESARRGFHAGPLIVLGHGILELFLLLLLLLGLAPILKNDQVIGSVGVVGAVVLIWMAVGMVRSLPSLSLERVSKDSKSTNPVWAGVLMSLANPYWIIWWATIGLGYILYSFTVGLLGVAAFFAGHILADLAWYAAVSFAVAHGRRFMSDKIYKGVIACCALALLVFAIYFGFSGAQRLI
jgi:threonine/homoserine/homoserine lactone efflux protein